jgi:uncharacterized protein (UPF0332 family)
VSQPERSRQELAAARHLLAGGFAAQALSRAYFAAFYAAEAAVSRLGESRSKHAGVIAAFIRLAVREGDLDPDVGRLLRSLFERRNAADYQPWEVPAGEAEAGIADAERFVDTVAAWERGRSDP